MGGNRVRTVRVRIRGRVQGVGYRHWTELAAGDGGVSGWVRNRRDGSVEALFSGSPDDVAQIIDQCRGGPPSAQVTSVDVEEESSAPAPGFVVLPTV